MSIAGRTVTAALLVCPVIVLGTGVANAYQGPVLKPVDLPVTIPSEAGAVAGDAAFVGEAAAVGSAGAVGIVAFGIGYGLHWEYDYFSKKYANPDDQYVGWVGNTPDCTADQDAGNAEVASACWQHDASFQYGTYGLAVPWEMQLRYLDYSSRPRGFSLRVDWDCRNLDTGERYVAGVDHVASTWTTSPYPDGSGFGKVFTYLGEGDYPGGALCQKQADQATYDPISRLDNNAHQIGGSGVWDDGLSGNPSRSVTTTGTCSGGGSAVSATTSSFTPAPGSTSTRPDMAAPTCPAGQLLTSLQADDSQGHHLATWTAPASWTDPTSPYYSCEGGSGGVPCKVVLKNAAGETCAASAGTADCTGYDPAADPATSPYKCYWGPTLVALSDCGYAKRTVTADPQPSTSNSPSTDPSVEPQPQPSTSGSPKPSTSTGTDPSTSSSPGVSPGAGPGGSPGGDTSGSPGSSGSPSPGGIPAANPVDPTGPDGSNQQTSCYPHGLGMLNPVEWVLKPVECALKWAFVPSAGQMASVDSLGTDMSSKAPFGTFTAMNTYVGNLTGAGRTCSGVFAIDLPLGSYLGTVHVLSTADSGGIAGQLQDYRPLMSVALYAMVCVPLVWWAWHAYAPASTDTG